MLLRIGAVSRETVRRVTFIRRAQEMGFTLAEVRQLLALRVREQLRALGAMDVVLSRLIRACDRLKETEECPMQAALDAAPRR